MLPSNYIFVKNISNEHLNDMISNVTIQDNELILKFYLI